MVSTNYFKLHVHNIVTRAFQGAPFSVNEQPPSDATKQDIKEIENPGTFSGLYQCWRWVRPEPTFLVFLFSAMGTLLLIENTAVIYTITPTLMIYISTCVIIPSLHFVMGN